MKSNTLSWLKLNQKDKIINLLRQKKVILAPSDTVFGLTGIVCQELFDELNRLKGRSDKPFLILARSLHDVSRVAEIPKTDSFLKIINTWWPGPLTIIFKARKDAPEYLVSKERTIAVRIPNDTFLQELLAVFPLLFSTSANKTGQPVPSDIDHIDDALKHEVAAVVVNEKALQPQSTVPSTIIDVTGSSITCIREGAIPWETISKTME